MLIIVPAIPDCLRIAWDLVHSKCSINVSNSQELAIESGRVIERKN